MSKPGAGLKRLVPTAELQEGVRGGRDLVCAAGTKCTRQTCSSLWRVHGQCCLQGQKILPDVISPPSYPSPCSVHLSPMASLLVLEPTQPTPTAGLMHLL